MKNATEPAVKHKAATPEVKRPGKEDGEPQGSEFWGFVYSVIGKLFAMLLRFIDFLEGLQFYARIVYGIVCFVLMILGIYVYLPS